MAWLTEETLDTIWTSEDTVILLEDVAWEEVPTYVTWDLLTTQTWDRFDGWGVESTGESAWNEESEDSGVWTPEASRTDTWV